MPGTKVPDREAGDTTALAKTDRDAPNRLEKNGFVPPRSRTKSKASPNESNGLGPTQAIAKSPAKPNSAVKADRLPQQQASTVPVIVTPAKVTDTDFAAATMRPLCESTNPQLTRSQDFAPTDNSTNELRPQSSGLSQIEQQQVADDSSFSHEGAKISSQLVTSDIARNLSDKAFEPGVATQRQAAMQTSFDAETRQTTELTGEPKNGSASDDLSTGTHSAPPTVKRQKIKQPQVHLVLAGESFWLIAQEHYDDGRFFRALYEYNKQRVGSFENLLPGTTLATPPKTELTKLWPELCPGPDDSSPVSTNIRERIYVTQEGDTLFEIARQRLAQASRYLDIQKLNQFRLPESVNHLSPLPAGIQLVLPLDVSQ